LFCFDIDINKEVAGIEINMEMADIDINMEMAENMDMGDGRHG
jgi:hypothetical protein